MRRSNGTSTDFTWRLSPAWDTALQDQVGGSASRSTVWPVISEITNEVFVQVQDRETGKLGGGGDEKVGYRRSTVVTTISERQEHGHSAIFDGRSQVFNRHRRDRWTPQSSAQIAG